MTYVSPTKPMKHQVEAQRRLKLRPKKPTDADVMAWIMEQGTGKSKVVLDEWQARVGAGELMDLLVVAPAGSYRNWCEDKNELQRSELNTHLDPVLRKQVLVGVWGKGAQNKRRLKAILDVKNRPRAIFINVEAISTSQEAEDVAKEFLSSGRAMFVIDESTVIRAKKSERTKALVTRLGPLAKARRILTGLITPKSPMDLFWQFYFLDWRILGFESFVSFRSRYANVKKVCYERNEVIRATLLKYAGFDKHEKTVLSDKLLRNKLALVYEGKRTISQTMPRRQVIQELLVAVDGLNRDDAVDVILRLGGWIKHQPKIESFKNLEELQVKIAQYSYRVLKEDCLDLKPKTYMIRDVEMTDEQKKAYKEMLSYATTEIGGHWVNAQVIIAKILRLHTIALGFAKDENGVIRDLKSNRIDELIDVLEDHSGKAIIWSCYRYDIEKIVARLKEEYGPQSVAAFHGGNKNTRVEEERRFLTRDDCRWMVSSQAAGGRGNTWNVADLTVYMSNNHDLELRAQSEDRNHRTGQKRAVTYIDMLCRGTVEEKIIQALRKKIDLATAITGENYREWLI